MVYKQKEIIWYVWNCPFLCGTLSTLRIHLLNDSNVLLSSVQFSPLSRVQFFVTLWTAARQASLSIAHSWSLPKLTFIESVIPSNHLILCHPLLLCLQSSPASGSFLMSWLFASGRQSIGVSASASVLPVNIQD